MARCLLLIDIFLRYLPLVFWRGGRGAPRQKATSDLGFSQAGRGQPAKIRSIYHK